MSEYIVKKGKNKDLIPLLLMDPVCQVYSLYVCETKPERESVVAVNKDSLQIEAILITGKPDLYVAAGYYLTAINTDSAVEVMKTIENLTDNSILYPLYLEKAVRTVFPEGNYSMDCINIYNEAADNQLLVQNSTLAKGASVQYLTRELFESLEIDSRFHEMVTAQDLEPVSKFYGVILNNKLVAIGEHELENSVSCGISQVYTLEEYRGRGYASSLIRQIAKKIHNNNKIPIYHHSVDNIGSKKACNHASFIECIKLGFMEV